MAGPIEVRDPADPRLADYVSLTDSALRLSMESRDGVFVAEGEKVIRRALAAGFAARSLLVTASRLARLGSLAQDCAGPVYVVADDVARVLTGYQVHRGALASMARRELPAVAGVLDGARRVVVLEDLVDHGNVGAIFRCAAAFGIDAVILSPRCADPLYRRAVKVSMGAVFAIPYARMPDWYGGLAQLRAAGFRLLALTPDQSAAPIGAALGPGSRAGRAGRAAARHRGGWPVLALAARGRPVGVHPDGPAREGGRRGLPQRGRGRRHRLPRPRHPAALGMTETLAHGSHRSWPAGTFPTERAPFRGVLPVSANVP